MPIPYRLHSGSWRPARLRKIDHIVLTLWLIAAGWVRAGDYTFGDDAFSARNFMYAAAPSWVWGVIGFGMGVAILTFGVVTKRHLLVFIGHAWVGVAYMLNALALVIATSNELPALDGIRGAGAVSFVGMVHVLGALRMGVAPLQQRDGVDVFISEHITQAEGRRDA